MIFDEKCIIINKEKGAEYIMNKSENYYKKKDKLFNKIFFIPMFFFVLLCILVCFTKDGVNEKALLGALAISCIWLAVSFILSNIIALIFYKDKTPVKEGECDNTLEHQTENKKNFISDNLEKDNKVFEYNFNNANLYKIQGELSYFIFNKQKYIESDKKKHIGNYFTSLTMLGVLSGVLLAKSFGIQYLIVWYIFFVAFMYYVINKSLINNAIKRGINSKITISKNGITVESSVKISIDWEQVEIIGFTKNVLMIIIKGSRVNVIIEPKEEIFNEIKKYTSAKIIIDR